MISRAAKGRVAGQPASWRLAAAGQVSVHQ